MYFKNPENSRVMIQKTILLHAPFIAENGIRYSLVKATYNSKGELNRDRNNVIWIFHGLTANSNPQEWWPTMVGSRKVFDTDRYFVICVNMLGSCYGTEYVEDEPLVAMDSYLARFSISDQTSFFKCVAKHLGINRIELLVGASVGGFIAIDWAIQEPLFIRKLALIATTFKVSPWAAAFNEAQRLALLADASFHSSAPNAGRYGLTAARAIAMLSYRGYKAFEKTQEGRNECSPHLHKATTYQRYQGEKLAHRFSATSYLNIINCFDSFDILKYGVIYERSLDQILANTLIVGISSDLLFPIEEQFQLSSMIRNSTIRIVESDFGHDSFLVESDQIATHILESLFI